jgi:hypothetical protein
VAPARTMPTGKAGKPANSASRAAPDRQPFVGCHGERPPAPKGAVDTAAKPKAPSSPVVPYLTGRDESQAKSCRVITAGALRLATTVSGGRRLDLDRGPARVVLRFDAAPVMFG